MDYQSLHGQDVTNISPPSAHRMPTVSAAQALQDLKSPATKAVSTRLPRLDYVLQNSLCGGPDVDFKGGVSRGQVTEVYGAPGVGKTTLGMQLAVEALSAGQEVVWIDAANRLPGPRLQQMLESSSSSALDETRSQVAMASVECQLEKFMHFSLSSLPHFMALLCHPHVSFPPPKVSLIVVDSFSSLIANAYSRVPDNAATPQKAGMNPKNDPSYWAATRKWAVLQSIVSSLQKLATIRNIAVVVLNQTATKMQPGGSAALVPAVSSAGWDAGIATRIVLYRDWGWEDKQIRFATITKVNGTATSGDGSGGRVIAFTIENDGLKESTIPDRGLSVPFLLATPTRKRKAIEIMDSEDEGDLGDSDEEFGLRDEDIGAIPEPSQYQGSEDILVPGPQDVEDDEDEEEDCGDGGGDSHNTDVDEDELAK